MGIFNILKIIPHSFFKRTTEIRNIRRSSILSVQPQTNVASNFVKTLQRTLPVISVRCRGTTSAVFPPQAFEGRPKLDEKVTYQPDVRLENVQEIIDAYLSVNDIAFILDFININILTACTAFADTAWWTARNEDGKLLGWVISSIFADGHHGWVASLCVRKEYRGTELPARLYGSAVYDVMHADTTTPRNFWTAGYPRSVELTKTLFPAMKIMQDRYVCGSMGKPTKYHTDLFPAAGKDFDIVPYTREDLFEKVFQWDTAEVHGQIPRESYLDILLAPPVMTAYVAVNKSGNVVGYGGLQETFNPLYQMLSPLYAENNNIAMALLHHLMKHYKGNNIGIMYFDEPAAFDLIDKMGFNVDVKIQCFHSGIAYPLPEQMKNKYFIPNGLNVMF